MTGFWQSFKYTSQKQIDRFFVSISPWRRHWKLPAINFSQNTWRYCPLVFVYFLFSLMFCDNVIFDLLKIERKEWSRIIQVSIKRKQIVSQASNPTKDINEILSSTGHSQSSANQETLQDSKLNYHINALNIKR